VIEPRIASAWRRSIVYEFTFSTPAGKPDWSLLVSLSGKLEFPELPELGSLTATGQLSNRINKATGVRTLTGCATVDLSTQDPAPQILGIELPDLSVSGCFDEVLPLTADKHRKIAVIGEFAVNPRYQGNGSSEVKPPRVDGFMDIVREDPAEDASED